VTPRDWQALWLGMCAALALDRLADGRLWFAALWAFNAALQYAFLRWRQRTET
jgi:hypothetical protein